VDYIVQNTVGKLLDGKTPRQASKLRILDPACGSGSFLIGAYEHLLKWHLNYYINNDPAKSARGSKPVLVQTSGGRYQLTIAERKRILLDNIYGVDIDAQAVETTKLSLLLKVLEGETQQTLQPVLRMFQERALPDLGDNIKCGNSLIGPDFYQQQQLNLLTDEEHYRINVFDWEKEFPQVFGSGALAARLAKPPPHLPWMTSPRPVCPCMGASVTRKGKPLRPRQPQCRVELNGKEDSMP
jgi:type II restriction/modification system DNA methylase subunit YeeA